MDSVRATQILPQAERSRGSPQCSKCTSGFLAVLHIPEYFAPPCVQKHNFTPVHLARSDERHYIDSLMHVCARVSYCQALLHFPCLHFWFLDSVLVFLVSCIFDVLSVPHVAFACFLDSEPDCHHCTSALDF